MDSEPKRESVASKETPTVNSIRPLIIRDDHILLGQLKDLREKERKPDNSSIPPWDLPLIEVEVADLDPEGIVLGINQGLAIQVAVEEIIEDKEEFESGRIPGQTRFRTIVPVCQYQGGTAYCNSLRYQKFEWVPIREVFDRQLESGAADRLRKYLSLKGAKK
jgi:hypothetical protein